MTINQNQENIEFNEPLPTFLTEKHKMGEEISITGKWVPRKPGSIFRKSQDAKDMIEEWENIHERTVMNI